MEDPQNAISQCVTTSLSKKGCIIEVFTPQEIENISSELLFDIIIAFNKEALIVVADFFRKKSIPIIYVFHDIEKNLVWNHPMIIKNFIINTSEYQLPLFIARNKDYCPIRPIFDIKDIRQNKVSKFNSKELHLLFYVNDKVLLSLVAEINKVIHYKTTIICDNFNLFRSVFNASVRVLESSKVSLSEQISKTNIFIGEKSGAALSIFMCKSTIIAGQDGYGGLISTLNITEQTQNGLKGRIGGRNDEYIPVDLLFKDIDSCAQKHQSITYNDTLLLLSNRLNEDSDNHLNVITDYIISFLSTKMMKFENKLLVLNSDYFITAISGNKHLITDGRICKHMAILSDEEYYYIRQFNKPQTLKQILNQTSTLSVNEVENLLIELLNEHIIETINE